MGECDRSLGAENYGVASAERYQELLPGKAPLGRFVDGARCKSLDGRYWENVFSCAAYGCCGTCLGVCPAGEAV